MIKKVRQIPVVWYAVIDFFTAAAAWTCFYFIRKLLLSSPVGIPSTGGNRFWLPLFILPVGWLVLYSLVGFYRSLYKKSRLFEFTNTFICSIIGCIILFFLLLLDDVKHNYFITTFLFSFCFPHILFSRLPVVHSF